MLYLEVLPMVEHKEGKFRHLGRVCEAVVDIVSLPLEVTPEATA
jgi:hypothetical protein